MQGRRVICMILAGLAVLTLAACGQVDQPTLVSDAEDMVNRVMELADPNPPADVSLPELAVVAEPVLEAFMEELLPAAEPEPSAEPGPASSEEPGSLEATEEPDAGSEEKELRPGTYVGADDSVLTVAEDGTCTYETMIAEPEDGAPLDGPVTFHGTVDNGVISFEKVTYYGLDITALAAQAGYDDGSYWENEAIAIYNG